MKPDALKQALYKAAHQPEQQAELAQAAGAWFSGAPEEDGWADFVDFFVLEWVDRDGFSLLERIVGDPLTDLGRSWLTGVRSGVFVVDEIDGPLAFCRDVCTDEDLCLVLGDALAPRSVIQGRLLPDGKGRYNLSGDPDIYDPMRVIARLSLARQWKEGTRYQLISQQSALRIGFLRQREQRRAFLGFFGSDQLLFPNGLELEQHMNNFMAHLLFRHCPPGLGGRTFADQHQEATGESPHQVKVELSEGLAAAGAVGVIYDPQEGIHFLPAFDAFVAHLQGHEDHESIVRSYLQDPGITALPFLRVGGAERLAALLNVPVAPMAELLAPFKSRPERRSPSVLPHFDD
jgi:hypothetical protein